MSILGTPTSDFSGPVSETQSLKEAYDLLFTAWKMVTIDFANTPTKDLENTITWHYYGKIEAEKARQTDDGVRQYCFSFLPGTAIVNQDKIVGISDIQIQFGYDERQRFTLEAKLLNKRGRSNAGAYVGKEGMGRFISGKQYGINALAGGMIGYVLDGDTEEARKTVADKIAVERQALRMSATGALGNSKLRESVYMTLHEREHSSNQFTIYHVFLPARR